MKRTTTLDTEDFERVFEHRAMVVAYCRRRGSRDPEGIAAEVMRIAWQQRAQLNPKSCRPWLITTARNLLLEEYRSRRRSFPLDPGVLSQIDQRREEEFEVESLDPELDRALSALSSGDREALLLLAWEDLTPSQAAASLGIRPATFRVKLHRARRRLKALLAEQTFDPSTQADRPVEEGT